jgi:hypothetical protein
MQRFSLCAVVHRLVRRTWLVTAITVISCAGFAARGAASIMAASYIETDAVPPGMVRPAPPALHAAIPDPTFRDHRRGVQGGELVVRNMFCSSCGPLGVTRGLGGPGDLVLAQALLIETSVGDEPRATVRVLASEVQGSWGVGDTIPGLGQVEHIAYQWIDLVDRTGRRGRLQLLASADSSLAPAAGRGPDTAMSESPPAPWSTRIRKLDDQNYDVDRDLVRELVTGTAKDRARPVPILENGEIKGIRLLGINPTSIAFGLGLKNGDSLTAIDGEPIKNVQQLLDLYAKLDQLSSVELSGKRAGKPLVRTLRLR